MQARDRGAALSVWLLCQPSDGDEDHRALIEASAKLHADNASFHPHPTIVLVVDEGLPPPDAAWRKRIAESSRGRRSGVLFAFVTKSAIARGVYTAINWLRRPIFKHGAFESVELAERWIVGERGPTPEVRKLVAEARATVMLRASKRSA